MSGLVELNRVAVCLPSGVSNVGIDLRVNREKRGSQTSRSQSSDDGCPLMPYLGANSLQRHASCLTVNARSLLNVLHIGNIQHFAGQSLFKSQAALPPGSTGYLSMLPPRFLVRFQLSTNGSEWKRCRVRKDLRVSKVHQHRCDVD